MSMVSASNGVLGKPGDSGSFVLDQYKGVIGMVMEGFEPKVTVHFIDMDIKEAGGGAEKVIDNSKAIRMTHVCILISICLNPQNDSLWKRTDVYLTPKRSRMP